MVVAVLGAPRLVVCDIGSGLLSLLPHLAEIISSAAASAIAIQGGNDAEGSALKSQLRSLQVHYKAWCVAKEPLTC